MLSGIASFLINASFHPLISYSTGFSFHIDWVPLFFFEDVCHQLRKPTLSQVSQLSGSWPSFGAEHHKKRREFVCQVNDQEMSYSLWGTDWGYREETVADLNLEFDRITYFAWASALPNNHRVSLREFERVVLPTVASLVTNCSWWYRAPKRSAQNRIFFNAFKNCPGFNEITVEEQGEESRDFVARQVEFGNIQWLNLSGTDRWREAENLAETLKIFVSSARFYALNYRNPLRDDYELFELFLGTRSGGELKPGARISAPSTHLVEIQLLALSPEFSSTKGEWEIPDSNLRIALFHLEGLLELEVE